jgi:lactate permease
VQEHELPITLGYWALAIAPIVLILILLVGLRWKAPEAAPLGMFLAAAIGLTFYEAPFQAVAVAAGKGIWDAVFILFVVWPALILYRVVHRAGGFHALRVGIERFSQNDLFLVLGFGWVFTSFLQGIAGFGVPIAVVAPLLLALGVRPVYAVAIPLIGHAWANLFGTLAVAWLATLTVVDLQDETRTAFETGILLWIPNVIGGIAIAWLFGRTRAVWLALPMVLIISTIHGGGQLVLTLWNPILSNFIPTTIALLSLAPLSRWERYSSAAEELESLVMSQDSEAEGRQKTESEQDPVMGLPMAIMPYIALTIIAVGALAIPPVEETLAQVEVGFPFPETETGYGVVSEAEDPYSPFEPLTHPGTVLLLAAAIAWVVYRQRGYYSRWAEREEQTNFWTSVADDATPASAAIVAFLVMSTVMGETGQTDVLALGIGEVAPMAVFAFLAAWIGLLGAFMTSSNTASNVLFAPLQQTVAEAEGLSETSIIASQHAGGAIGNSISPANVVLGTGTTGIGGKEGSVLRVTLPFAIAMTIGVGVGTMILTLGQWL